MKKLALTAVAVLLAGPAFADPDISGEPIDFQLTGEVESECYLLLSSSNFNDTLDFGLPEAGDTLSGALSFLCNDADGATLTMTSAQGGLMNVDKTSEKVTYAATLSVGTNASATLTTTETEDESEDLDLQPNVSLRTANVSIELLEDATFAGEYLDTLTIQIAAN